MRCHEAAVAAAGARIAFVGSGTPAMAIDFARAHAGPHPVLADPERRAFAAAGMRRGWWSTVRPSLVVHLVRALLRGHRQSKVQGDAWQQGGVLVIGADRTLRHRQCDVVAGEELDFAAVIAALR